MASCALPLLLPARKIGDDHFCDGGVRFNTPISAALRAGAERLLIVSLLSDEGQSNVSVAAQDRVRAYNSPIFVIGKVLTALLLDPFHRDIRTLASINDLIRAIDRVVPARELEGLDRVIEEVRGLPYREVPTLFFSPSQDLGRVAREHADRISGTRFSSWLLARAAVLGTVLESDLESFVLFDGGFAGDLIELGRSDALARRDEIRHFFASSAVRKPRAHSGTAFGTENP
jgi:NTE family protein